VCFSLPVSSPSQAAVLFLPLDARSLVRVARREERQRGKAEQKRMAAEEAIGQARILAKPAFALFVLSNGVFTSSKR
jgi:hypothetical protein